MARPRFSLRWKIAGLSAGLLLVGVAALAFVTVYQRRATAPLRWWELPAIGALFAAYSYLFVVSQAWAWARMAARRGSWAKTPRVTAEIAVQMPV